MVSVPTIGFGLRTDRNIKPYDGIIGGKGYKLVWDTPDRIHYLVGKGGAIYLVEEKVE